MNKFEIINDEALTQVDGGVWDLFVALAVYILIETINNPNDAKQGFSDGLSGK